MPADVLFLITLVGLTMIHVSAAEGARAYWDGKGRPAACYMLLAMVGWLTVIAVVTRSLPWGTL